MNLRPVRVGPDIVARDGLVARFAAELDPMSENTAERFARRMAILAHEAYAATREHFEPTEDEL